MLERIKRIAKRPLFWVLFVIVLLIGWGVFSSIKNGNKSPYEFIAVKKGNITQEVSVTGRVKPAQNVDLAFEKSGKIAAINVKVGDKVSANQTLMSLVNDDMVAQVNQATASLMSQQAKLDELKKGTRPEELQAARTTVANAQKSYDDANSNLASVTAKAEADLRSAYDSALSAAAKSVTVAMNSLYVLTDIQFNYFIGNDTTSMALAEAKSQAVFYLLGDANSGRASTVYISLLNGGAKKSVQNAQANPTYANIDKALNDVNLALEKTKLALDAVPISSSLTSTERTNLNTEKSNVNAEIITTTGKIQTIEVQKATNSYSVATAQSSLTTAQNTLNSAKDQLALKEAGSTSETIKAQEAAVRSAQANVDNYLSLLSKTIIRSPIAGIITKQDAKVGEIISANVNLVSVMSAAQFEIEANVPEADIAKVQIGNMARVTLDTYGNGVIFEAKVVKIDPAETMVEGVATYKTTFQFIKEDERIKSGMTANIDIVTAQKNDILVVPQRAVIQKAGERYVMIDLGSNETKERAVQVGIKGTDGNVEIISGLNEGDRVASYGEKVK